MEKSIANRLKRVRDVLETDGAEALIETHPPNIYYLSGFTGDAGILLVQPTSVTLFTDGRFTIQAKQEAPGIRTHIHRGGPLVGSIGAYLRRKTRPRVAISPARLSLSNWTILKKAAGKGVRWVASDGIVDRLRAAKEATEIDRIRAPARAGSKAMDETIRLVDPGVME